MRVAQQLLRSGLCSVNLIKFAPAVRAGHRGAYERQKRPALTATADFREPMGTYLRPQLLMRSRTLARDTLSPAVTGSSSTKSIRVGFL